MTAQALRLVRASLANLKLDGAWAAILLLLALLALLDQAQFAASLQFTLEQFLEVLPFLTLAIALAAYAKASGADALIARAFSGHVALMILFAALIGGLSPFCSCGVIPLIAALLAMGVPLPAVMAFWLSSPLMDPSMFALTLGTLGMAFAIGKTVAAVGVGLMGGYAVWALSATGAFANPLRPGVSGGCCGTSTIRTPAPVHWRIWDEPPRLQTFAKEAAHVFAFLGKWLALAFLLESLMLAYIPGEWIAQLLGGGGLTGTAVAALVGVPAYLNGYAALPLVSGLVDSGMDPGAAMAFLVAGGVSSCPAAIAVFALVRVPVFAAYAALAFIGAVSSGLLFALAV
jgi:uncharacterized membrane protein YraQ (UPF0718 family)